jgi:hypothetical protein
MNSQKCTKCGLISWADATTCKRCGESLLEQSQTTHERSKPSNVPDAISCILLGVAVFCVAFNQYLGPFGYPVSILVLVIGLTYSIMRVYRSTRSPQSDRKREAMTALVVNALLLMVLGAAVPVYFLSRSPESKSFEWREFASINGRYTIQLPDEAQEVQQKIQTATGPVTLNSVTVNMGQRGKYESGYYDLADRMVTVSDDEFLDLLLESTVRQDKRGLMNKRPLVINAPNGLTVRALEGDVQLDVQTTSISRVYWVKERSTVYVNSTLFQSATQNEVSAQKFLDSFQLVAR